jgi:predicted amidohydrolase YtcJ
MKQLYEGVPIYTLNPGNQVAEAMVVEGGRVEAVGARRELIERFPHARRVPLEGGAVIPSFNDCHAHLLRLGQDLARAELRHCRTAEEIAEALRENSLRFPGSGWLVGVNYDQNILPGGNHLTLEELDAIGNGRPVYLFHLSRHEGMANSKAMALGGIGESTPDPPEGRIERDASGRPNGRLLEMAVRLVEQALPIPGEASLVKALSASLKLQAERGILIATDATTGKWFGLEKEWSSFARAVESAGVKVTLMPDVDACRSLGWMQRGRVELPPASNQLRLGPMKFIADGALTNRTAALNEPYIDGSGRGLLVYPPDELRAMILEAQRGGWRCAVHAIGDRAIEIVLSAFEEGNRFRQGQRFGHRVEHCMLVNAAMNQKMSELGVMPCVQPEFLYNLGHAYRQALGDRAEALIPFRSWIRKGLPLAFSSDQPIATGDPILGWRSAVLRSTRDGDVLGAEECLDPLTALRAYTVGSALASADDSVGTLEPGKEARFALLSHRPERIVEEDMRVLGSSLSLTSDTNPFSE